MTWRELKEAIGKMPESQLDNDVKAWGESLGLTCANLESTGEAMYYNLEWGDEGCEAASNIEPEELDDCIKVCDKGYYYLWVE